MPMWTVPRTGYDTNQQTGERRWTSMIQMVDRRPLQV
jgi:hypothetical protein